MDLYLYPEEGSSVVFSSENGASKTFTFPSGYVYYGLFVRVHPNITVNTTVYPMLNKGETALPYEPYFEGLRSAPVTEVESVGANLIPYPYRSTTITKSGVTFTDNGDGSITLNGTATATDTFVLWLNTEKPLSTGDYSSIANGVCDIRCYHPDMTESTIQGSGGTINATKPITNITLLIRNGLTYNGTVYPMLNKGSTALPYSPYVRNTLPVFEAVQNLDGYGWGVNESVYNYIDWEKKQFVKLVGCVVLNGSEAWFIYDNKLFSNAVDSLALESGVCIHSDSVFDIKISGGSNRLVAYSDGSMDVVAWNAHLSQNPVILYYELAEPVITDISDMLTDDNFIQVEGGGTLTFKNEYEYDVPSEIEYQLEV